jgi:hypothetical protein
MEPTRRHTQEPQDRPQREVPLGPIHGARIRILARPSGRRASVRLGEYRMSVGTARQVADDRLTPLAGSQLDQEKRLETWIVRDRLILRMDVATAGREVSKQTMAGGFRFRESSTAKSEINGGVQFTLVTAGRPQRGPAPSRGSEHAGQRRSGSGKRRCSTRRERGTKCDSMVHKRRVSL